MTFSTPLDFSRYGTTSEEWKEFERANAELIKSFSMSHSKSTDPADIQAAMNRLGEEGSKSRLEKRGLWDVVEAQDYSVAGRDGNAIPIRCYRPKASGQKTLPVYIYYHGGGYFVGSLETDEWMCVTWAHELSIAVISVNYRHTPQVSGLAPWHDSIDAFEWIADNTSTLGVDPERITVGGISAGGSLAAAVATHDVRKAIAAGTTPRIRGQVLAIPVLFLDFPYHLFASKEKVAHFQNANSAILGQADMDYICELLRKNSDVPLDHPTWNPGATEKDVLQHMPRTAIIASGSDVLRDHPLLYAHRLQDAKYDFPSSGHDCRRDVY